MRTALTIAGTDPSGGAGIQADIKTMTVNGVYAMSAVTALVAQNTTGVRSIVECTPAFLAEQLDCVFTDIFPDAVKTGMVSNIALIETIADKLTQYGARNLVVDPVMVATSGDRLISEDAVETLKARLLPLALVITPNIPEAEILSGRTISTAAEMEAAARSIYDRYGCAVLCKGGHNLNDANDLLWRAEGGKWFAATSTIPTPTAPAAPSPAPLPPTWPRAAGWTRPWSGQKPISPVHWRPCWTWAAAPAPWTTPLTSSPRTGRRQIKGVNRNYLDFVPRFQRYTQCLKISTSASQKNS